MSYGYSQDLRERVLRAIDAGQSKTEVAQRFAITRQTIHNWLLLRQEQGAVLIRRRCRSASKLHKPELEAYIAAHPDAYLHEIAQHFHASASGVLRACRRLKISRKKNSAVRRAPGSRAAGI